MASWVWAGDGAGVSGDGFTRAVRERERRDRGVSSCAVVGADATELRSTTISTKSKPICLLNPFLTLQCSLTPRMWHWHRDLMPFWVLPR